jgi:hypothetical protein
LNLLKCRFGCAQPENAISKGLVRLAPSPQFCGKAPRAGLAPGRFRAHIREMGRNVAIVVGAGLIALAIMVTNHWAIIPGGSNSIAATIRLNRWTGSIDVCSLNAKSVTGSNASGLQLTCEVQ